MAAVTSVPLRVPAHSGQRWTLRVALAAAGIVAAALAAALHLPIAVAEPVFTAINVAVIATLVTLGLHLALAEGEHFTGYAFAFAGLSWCLVALDATVPEWGPYVAWTFTGITYMSIGWAVLRYRRPRLATPVERSFVPISALVTVGFSFAAAFVIPPEVLGYPADTFWPAVIDIPHGASIAILVLCAGYLSLGVLYCVLMVRMVDGAPRISRSILKPMALFGAFLAMGAAIVQTVAALIPEVFNVHHAVATVGALLLGLCSAFAVGTMLQQAAGSRLLSQLPIVRTPESVTEYLRGVLGDPTAEILYWSPEADHLVEADGTRRPLDLVPGPEDRYSAWIVGSDGERIAMLLAAPGIGADQVALDALGRVLSIVADNTRLNVLLRTRLAELTATRTAEALAFDRAREQFHRNLHDGLQQTLAAIRLDLDGLHDVVPTPDGRAVVADVEAKLTLALGQVHSLRDGADPPELRFGLKPAIDRTVAELHLPASCRVADVDLGILTLPVYYLVRESLTNVHKHARASQVDVDVRTDGRTVEVSVHDDGCGSAAMREHGGIAGMRRRVEELGGTFILNSVPGQGTRLDVTVPRVS